MVILCLLVLLLLLLWLFFGQTPHDASGSLTRPHTGASAVVAPDSVRSVLADSTETVSGASGQKNPLPRSRARQATSADTGSASTDTVSAADSASAEGSDSAALSESEATQAPPTPCELDTVMPWVYPDPSGGLHRGEARVVLVADKKNCTVEWRLNDSRDWSTYREGQEIAISASATLHFRAVDTCGNRMEERAEKYVIASHRASGRCPADMEYVEVSDTRFCIDRFEWPNRKGARPRAFVSVYQAMDSCAAAGKRLCSMDEWLVACSGPQSWKYTYGEAYEPHACVCQDTASAPSGSRRECRGYFDVYDMSGNLAEWTSTKSQKNPRYFDVMGGFWQTGIQSRCADVRYSYFPENKHNPVGFRCCADGKREK